MKARNKHKGHFQTISVILKLLIDQFGSNNDSDCVNQLPCVNCLFFDTFGPVIEHLLIFLTIFFQFLPKR